MSHTELTDEPCPECGASLDLMVTPPQGTPKVPSAPPDRRETIRLARAKVCPDCGWRETQRD